MAVTWRKAGTCGYVTLDNPPVNAIGREMRAGLTAAADWAEAEGLERVILSGAGRGFAAGADAAEFDRAPEPPHLPDVLARIEGSAVPWIAAVHGAALGGGAEILLACRYRIARPDAQIGFPEVTLGVVPGAGGTQRLPRLVGLTRALELVPTGKPVTGAEAKAMGLVDLLDDDPVSAAEMLNTEWLGMAVPVGELNTGDLPDAAFDAARATAAAKMRGQTAPQIAIDLLSLARRASLAEGMAAERVAFLELRQSEQARALRHIFFAERGAKAPNWLSAAPADLGRAVVVGGGTMGAGIAYALLRAGIAVTLIETDAEGVERARANTGRIIAQSRDRDLIDAATTAAIEARLSLSHDYADAAGAGLAIEAAFESLAVKEAVLGRLQAVMAPDAVLASNTSYLDLDAIAATLDDPTRLVGLHFFAPAHVMKLLEIVRGKATSGRALATGYALARRLGKVPVLAGVCDGFIGNRILARYREAADTLLMDGATPWEIDEAMEAFGYAMGPYAAQDLSGLDIAHANRRRQDATRDPARRYIPIADRMVAEGRLGRKTAVGWYRYPGGQQVVDPLVEDLIREEAHFAKVTRREFSADEIRHRLLLAMINEAAAILGEGIAASAADIDLVTVLGYGFPRWRGGLMRYADTLGPKRILTALRALAAEDPLVWRPSRVLEDCAATGTALAAWHRVEA